MAKQLKSSELDKIAFILPSHDDFNDLNIKVKDICNRLEALENRFSDTLELGRIRDLEVDVTKINCALREIKNEVYSLKLKDKIKKGLYV